MFKCFQALFYETFYHERVFFIEFVNMSFPYQICESQNGKNKFLLRLDVTIKFLHVLLVL